MHFEQKLYLWITYPTGFDYEEFAAEPNLTAYTVAMTNSDKHLPGYENAALLGTVRCQATILNADTIVARQLVALEAAQREVYLNAERAAATIREKMHKLQAIAGPTRLRDVVDEIELAATPVRPVDDISF